MKTGCRVVAFTFAAAAMLLLPACGAADESRLHGTWVADVDATIARMQETGAPEEALAQGRQELAKPEVKEVFVAFGDGTLTRRDTEGPVKEGTWKVVEEREGVWLLETKMGDADQPTRITVDWVDDERIIIAGPQGESPVLRRK